MKTITRIDARVAVMLQKLDHATNLLDAAVQLTTDVEAMRGAVFYGSQSDLKKRLTRLDALASAAKDLSQSIRSEIYVDPLGHDFGYQMGPGCSVCGRDEHIVEDR